MKLRIFFLILVVAGPLAFAQDNSNPREQLKQHIADLQKSPDNQELREKIIKLALTVDPKPAVPEEVDELAGQAAYAFKNAKTEADYLDAVKAYQKALLVAPWVPDYYFNLGVAQDKSGKPDEAIASFRFYLMAAPEAQDAKAVRERIGGLKYAIQKASEAQRQRDDSADRERQKKGGLQQFLNLVEGKRYWGYYCSSSEARKEGWTDGCKWDQYYGKNWTTSPYHSVQPLYLWEVRGDAAYLVENNSKSEQMRVRSQGPSLSDLIWEFHRAKDYLEGPNPPWTATPLMDFQSDFSQFTVGLYMRSKDEPSLNPNKVYQYRMYKAQ